MQRARQPCTHTRAVAVLIAGVRQGRQQSHSGRARRSPAVSARTEPVQCPCTAIKYPRVTGSDPTAPHGNVPAGLQRQRGAAGTTQIPAHIHREFLPEVQLHRSCIPSSVPTTPAPSHSSDPHKIPQTAPFHQTSPSLMPIPGTTVFPLLQTSVAMGPALENTLREMRVSAGGGGLCHRDHGGARWFTWKNNLLFWPQPCKRHPEYDPITWALGIEYELRG